MIDDTIAHTAAHWMQMSFNQQQNEFWWMTKVENHWVNQSGGDASLPSRNKSDFLEGAGWGWWEHWHTVAVWLEAWNYVPPPSNILQTWGNSGEACLIDMQAALQSESRDLNGFWKCTCTVGCHFDCFTCTVQDEYNMSSSFHIMTFHFQDDSVGNIKMPEREKAI